VALGIAPFCPKRNTPLHAAPFAGIDVVSHRLDRLRRGLKGRVEVRSISARWAWVEAVLARGGEAEGRAVLEAVHAGGSFAAYQRAFAALPQAKQSEGPRAIEAPSPGGRRRRGLAVLPQEAPVE
jgi:hypothetical protein